ncbi:MAG: hypothetical protein ACLQBD_15225, partial [Syntrophobacteraceae bacterium]
MQILRRALLAASDGSRLNPFSAAQFGQSILLYHVSNIQGARLQPSGANGHLEFNYFVLERPRWS